MNDEKGNQRLPLFDWAQRRQEVTSKDHTRAAGDDAGGAKTLTQERLKELLDYDPETGVFTRKTKGRRFPIGAIAGRLRRDGYLDTWIDSKIYLLHRLAWLYVYGVWPSGKWPDGHIDHINHDPKDNRICNLREGSRSQNLSNQKKAHRNNKSGFLGVHFHPASGKWRAQITVKGDQRFLGLFMTPVEAHSAYLTAKREFHDFNTL